MYVYAKLSDEIGHLARAGVETGSIGSSADGRMIPYVFAGSHGGRCIFITAAIHAREHIAAYCVMKQVYYALNRTKRLASFGGVYFIPMLNPDGNVIVQRGASGIRSGKEPLLRALYGKDCRLFKANANLVDLNVNFDAAWGTGAQNTGRPGCENYVGPHPFSEPETRAIRDFTLLHKPAATVSYHAIGRELYYEFGQGPEDLSRDRRIAEYLNERLGYAVRPDDGKSAGGYKDWCIQRLKIPAFTIELVSGEYGHPFFNYALAKEDIERNLDLPERLLQFSGY